MSDGTVLRIDLKTKAVAESRPAGLSAPDALAVSPNGTQVATLAMDAAGARKLVILNKDAEVTLLDFKPGEPAPRGFDFSPDGTRLVLDRTSDESKSGLWILTIATRTLTPLTDSGYAPVWYGR
jgi:DNA-binding beta-propeller fold protein YncE